MKGGGKLKVTFEQVRDALVETQGLKYLAARKLGASPAAMTKWLARWPALEDVVGEQKENMLDIAENKLFAAVEAGAPWAVCFSLKTQGRHRGYVQRSELTGEDGKPVQTTIVETVVRTREDARDLLSRLGAASAIPSRN